MEESEERKRILGAVALAAGYCRTLEEAGRMERDELVDAMLRSLPGLYMAFNEINPKDEGLEDHFVSFESYIDEDYYESIRRALEGVFGEDDTFLETFEEDMKYSDTPIASSISECLADIFQPLYNFACYVRDHGADNLLEVYMECRDNFAAYWSQTLCNVLRALNHLKYTR